MIFRFLSILIIFVATSCTTSKNREDSTELPWTNFRWVGNSIEGKYYDKFSIYIQVYLNDSKQETFAQLDLGSSTSMLYEIAINELQRLGHLKTFNKDTLQLDTAQQKQYFLSKDLKLTFNQQLINSNEILVRKNYGDKYDPTSPNITNKSVGTIGVDFFQNKILVIDYPNERLCIVDSLPSSYATTVNWQDCKFNGGSPLITLNIGGKDKNFIFDTGSSLFALLTTKDIFTSITENTKTDTLNVPSWGNILTVIGRPIKHDVKVGKLLLSKENAYYFMQQEIDAQFKAAGIDGLTGNKLFLGNTIFIDFKNGQFGVK